MYYLLSLLERAGNTEGKKTDRVLVVLMALLKLAVRCIESYNADKKVTHFLNLKVLNRLISPLHRIQLGSEMQAVSPALACQVSLCH